MARKSITGIATVIAPTAPHITVIAMGDGITVTVIITAVNLAATKAAEGKIDMIKELMHDPIFLAGKSEVATKEDLQVATDLLDMLMAHRESCVGVATNMG